jgi:hypothetical protein
MGGAWQVEATSCEGGPWMTTEGRPAFFRVPVDSAA